MAVSSDTDLGATMKAQKITPSKPNIPPAKPDEDVFLPEADRSTSTRDVPKVRLKPSALSVPWYRIKPSGRIEVIHVVDEMHDRLLIMADEDGYGRWKMKYDSDGDGSHYAKTRRRAMAMALGTKTEFFLRIKVTYDRLRAEIEDLRTRIEQEPIEPGAE